MQQHKTVKDDVIATGTIAAEGYDADPRERAEFVVTAIREHLRRKRIEDVAKIVAEHSVEYNHRLP